MVSQFNMAPLVCSFTGTSEPGLTKRFVYLLPIYYAILFVPADEYFSSYWFLIVSGDVFPKKFSSHLVIFFSFLVSNFYTCNLL